MSQTLPGACSKSRRGNRHNLQQGENIVRYKEEKLRVGAKPAEWLPRESAEPRSSGVLKDLPGHGHYPEKSALPLQLES